MIFKYAAKLLLPIAFYLLYLTGYSQEFKHINKGIVNQTRVNFDGSMMVLIGNYFGSFKLYISTYRKDSSFWDVPEKILDDHLTGWEVRDPMLNYDNTKLYFSAKSDGKPDYDVYVSEFINKTWSKPVALDIGINTEANELSPAISANEKIILFTRPFPPEAKTDDFCGQLYYAERTETGSWTTPELLPPAYNTGCVSTPYYARDNKTFFYSSYEDVADSEGKRIARKQFSIFWAKIDGLFKYNPKPILSIIGDEDLLYPSLDRDSTLYYNAGVFTKGEERVISRVLSASLPRSFQPVEMTLLSGQVTDETGSPLAAAISVINPYTTKVFQSTVSTEEGYYQLFVPMNEQFSLLAYKEGYSAQSKLIETAGRSLENDFELFPSVAITFNVFDQDFYFPIDARISLHDADFNLIREVSLERGEKMEIPLGKEFNIIFNSENYFPDTLNLPFNQEVIFDFFDFDIELKRKLKDVSLSFSDESGNNLGLEITVYNVTRNEKTKRVVKDGKITLQLRDGEVYEISTSAEGYSYYSAELDLTKEEGLEEVSATLKSVENVSLVLENITFEYNSYELTAESYNELNKLIEYLQENDQYKVEITAHTDSDGPQDYNLKLSNLRANAVLQYLQDNSIDKGRLVAIGYGESQPRFPNDTDENKAKNRRVEFKILAD